jgi:shikimate dehydrogenase
MTSTPVRLGLVGDGIGRSLSPGLHVILGDLTGRQVEYPTFDRDASFTSSLGTFLAECRAEGRAGINVTHPFKEAVCAHITPDPLVADMGACNTVCFTGEGDIGHNTDCTGLQKALDPLVDVEDRSVVALIGTGGFGRAAGFAMAALGVGELRLFDPSYPRAVDLARRLVATTDLQVAVCESADAACDDALGVVNCSPIGMHHHPGNPVTEQQLCSARWVFDAVYIPMRTEFLATAERLGAKAISGSELFFWQAIDAFEHFTGGTLDRSVIDRARQLVWPEVERRAGSGE